jgi:hypothetical protein
MNWGTKITLVYIGFVMLIVSLVFISATNKSELVATDYYEQELKFQDRIDAMNNERELSITINYEVLTQFIAFTYLNKEIKNDFKGEILFFRPSDSIKDIKVPLKFDVEGKQMINKSLLSKGIYKVCIYWKNNAKNFYKEAIITI